MTATKGALIDGPESVVVMRAKMHIHVRIKGHHEWDHATAWCWCAREVGEIFTLGGGLDLIEQVAWRPLQTREARPRELVA